MVEGNIDIKERDCGTCSACCRWPSIPELKKPPREPCWNLCGGKYGCKIYEHRPKSCSDYECRWLKGCGSEEDRPNICHVLIDKKLTQFGEALVAKSLRPGAIMTDQGKKAISRIAQDANMLCFIVDDNDSYRIIGCAGPKILTDEFRAKYGDNPNQLGDINGLVQNIIKQVKEGAN